MEMKDILKQHAEAIDLKLDSFGETLQKSASSLQTVDTRLTDIEQKMSRRGNASGGSGGEGLTVGEIVIGNEGLRGFAAELSESDRRPGRFKIETKAILTSDPGSVGAAAPHAYRDAAVMIPQRKLVVRSLIPVIPVTTGSVEYPHQTARNNNAATVAEAPTGTKPQSDFTMELKNTPVRTIAHWMQASNQIMADMPQLRGLIDTELLYGLALVEDGQLLLGDGTGTNLSGLIPNATAYAVPTGFTAPATGSFLDELGAALLQCALANFSPDGIVLHPTDWWKIRLLKDAQGKYLFGDPGEEVEPRIFGLPVVTTLAMPQGHFLVGQFMVAATLYDRLTATILISSEDRDNFVRNLLTILAEERIALAVKRSAALIYGAFS